MAADDDPTAPIAPAAPVAPAAPTDSDTPVPDDDGDRPAGGGAGDGAGEGAPAGPQQAGGGNLPGEKPAADSAPGSDGGPRPYTDAAPPVDPGFVDSYTRLWKQVERGKLKMRSLGEDLVAAQQVLSASTSDMALAIRARNMADFHLTDAAGQFDLAVRDMYITGTTDVDVILGVLGSKPEDVLRTIDSVVYMRSATGTESTDFDFAESAAVVAQSSAASVMIQASEDRARVETVRKALKKTKKELKRDQEELKRLIAVAAPQTVVGNNGCPKEVLEGTVPEGINIKQLCGMAVRTAASPQAAFAIKWALVRIGAPYACEGIGRLEAWRFDCSSFVSRAYAEGAGLRTAGNGWAPSTRNMVPVGRRLARPALRGHRAQGHPSRRPRALRHVPGGRGLPLPPRRDVPRPDGEGRAADDGAHQLLRQRGPCGPVHRRRRGQPARRAPGDPRLGGEDHRQARPAPAVRQGGQARQGRQEAGQQAGQQAEEAGQAESLRVGDIRS